jgi:hypothetical protein
MDEREDFERVIAIPSNKTFEDLHKAILQSVNFDDSQLASFYLTDDNWQEKMEITLIDMSSGEVEEDVFIPVMSETKLSDFVHSTGQKLTYVYDFVLMWSFRVELVGIEEKYDRNTHYPTVVSSLGEAPSQYGTAEKYPEAISEEEEDQYVQNIRKRNEEDILDDDEFDEDEDDNPFSEFEDGYDSGYGRDDYF